MRAAATFTALALALGSTLAGVQLVTASPSRADEYTISQNVTRDGWDSHEPALSHAAIRAKRFGQIFDAKVNGQVFAQPLVVGASVLVATEDDYVYSINRTTGKVNWSRQLGSPYAAAAEGCAQTPVVLPYIGVTSAPVYDPGTKTLYVSGMLSGPPGDDTDLSTATPSYDLFAMNEVTGAVKWEKQIAGSPTNNASNTFNAAIEMQRTGLLLLNGSVYLGFGALCADGAADHTYSGYVAGVNTKTKAETLWTDEAYDPTDPGFYSGVWQGGGGLVAVGNSIFVATANGTAPPLGTRGSAAPKTAHLGQSMVQLNVERNGSLEPVDFYSPGDADKMTALDHDFGSGGPILLPFGTRDYPHLFVTGDKEARIYLLNETRLGGRSSSPTGSTAVFSGSPSLVDQAQGEVDHGLWGHMAAFAGVGQNGKADDYIYYEGTGWNSTDKMYVLKFNGANPAKPVLQNIAATRQSFGFSSGSPVITSNGSKATSATVWEVQTTDDTGAGGRLDAYYALPTAKGVLDRIWSAPIGDASQFTVPATSGGRVYVGARNDATAATTGTNATVCPTNFEATSYTSTDSPCVGEVYAFGTRSAQLSGSTVRFGHVTLGHTATRTVTLTNTGDTAVKITKVATRVPFGRPSASAVGQTVAAGASIRLRISFTPRATGKTTGKYLVTTSDGFGTDTTTVAATGAGRAAASGVTVPSPGGGGSLSGSAKIARTTLQLTPASKGTSGSAVSYQPVAASGLTAKPSARLSYAFTGSTGTSTDQHLVQDAASGPGSGRPPM
jgi:hypothetical protein